MPNRARMLAALSLTLLAGPAVAAERTPESRFVQGVLAALPQPAPNEFPEPQRPLERFFEAVNAGDVDSALRCFELRSSSTDLETYFAFVGHYDAAQNAPLPDGVDRFEVLGRAFEQFGHAWRTLRLLALVASNPRLAQPIERTDPDWRARLDELKRMTVTLRYPRFRIDMKDMTLTPVDVAMRFQRKKLIVFSPRIGDHELGEMTAQVAFVRGNWRLVSISGP